MHEIGKALYAYPTLAQVVLGALGGPGDRLAITCGDMRLRYQDVRAGIGRAMTALSQAGLQRGDSVALLSENCAEIVYISFAAHVLGLRYTPLHPKGSHQDHCFILQDAGITTLIIDEQAFGGRLVDIRRDVPELGTIYALRGGQDVPALMDGETQPADLNPADGIDPADIAVLAYTGGTTGRPKGVMLSHQCVVHALLLSLAGWDWPEHVRFLIASPVSHAAGSMLTPTLIYGGSFHILPAFDPEAVCAAIERERITATFMVPTMIYALLDYPGRDRFDLSSLETVIYGAAPMSVQRLKEAINVFGPVFMQLYGQTEAPNTITVLPKRLHDPSRPEWLTSCGVPLPGVEVALLDPDLNPVPQGEIGEICARGPHIMSGYWRRPDETAAALKGGWLHTGDLGRFDEDGMLSIVGRLKEMIITGGFNVFPREVEDALVSHPSVAEAAVAGVPDPQWGERVVAFVVPASDVSVDLDTLVEHVRALKGPVQTPKQISLVKHMPLTPVGKIDKQQLVAAML